MGIMKSYYEISPFFFLIAASASFLYMSMNLFMVFGGDDGDFGEQVSSDFSFKFFSTQTTLAFFMGFGWAGITSTVKWKLPEWQAVLIAFGFGVLLMSFSAMLLYQIRKLNHTSTMSLYSALGVKGKVYTRIPPAGEGEGRIQVQVTGILKVISAVSMEEEIESFTEVEVIGVKDKDTVIVRRIIQNADGESA